MNIYKKLRTLANIIYFFSDLKVWSNINKIFPQKINNNEKWITKKRNVYILRKIIKDYKPKKIVEFGSGIGVSSENIVDQMSNECEFIGFENNDNCITQAKNRTKKYNKNIKFIKSKVVLSRDIIPIDTLTYEDTEKINYGDVDLVFIDGPSFLLTNENKFYSGLVRGDIFKIYNQLKIGCIIIIDGSYMTRKTIKRFCDKIKFINIPKSFIFKILKEDKLEDKSFKKMTEWGYF